MIEALQKELSNKYEVEMSQKEAAEKYIEEIEILIEDLKSKIAYLEANIEVFNSNLNSNFYEDE